MGFKRVNHEYMISTPQWLFAAAFFTVRHYSHIHYANASAHYGFSQVGITMTISCGKPWNYQSVNGHLICKKTNTRRKPKQMLGNGVYVATSGKFWSYSGLLELIKQVLKKFTLKKLTYGRTWHWIRIITSPPCQLAFSGGKSFHDNRNTFIRVLSMILW